MSEDNVVCVCVCNKIKYYSVLNKHEIMPFAATWMDLEGIVLSDISQIEKEYCMISCISGNKKNAIN